MHLPLWFKALVYSEIFLQLPFFFVATYAFIGARQHAAAALHSAQCASQAHMPARRAGLTTFLPSFAGMPPSPLDCFATAAMPSHLSLQARRTGSASPQCFMGPLSAPRCCPSSLSWRHTPVRTALVYAYLLVLLNWSRQHGCHLSIAMLPILAELAAHTGVQRLYWCMPEVHVLQVGAEAMQLPTCSPCSPCRELQPWLMASPSASDLLAGAVHSS